MVSSGLEQSTYQMTKAGYKLYKEFYLRDTVWHGIVKDDLAAAPKYGNDLAFTNSISPVNLIANYKCSQGDWGSAKFEFGKLATKSFSSEEGIWYSVDRGGNIRVHSYSSSGFGSS